MSGVKWPRSSALLNASPRGGFGLKPQENVPIKRTLDQFGNLIYSRDGEWWDGEWWNGSGGAAMKRAGGTTRHLGTEGD